MNKTTDELMNQLKEAKDIRQYLEDNAEEMVSSGLRKYIKDLAKEKNLTIVEAARRAQISDSYLYKINEGKKINISRDVMIQVCFGLGLDAEESRMLMCVAGVGDLCPRIRRDSIVLFCLENHIDIIECNRMLEAWGDSPIFDE